MHELLSARRDEVLRQVATKTEVPFLATFYDQVVAALRKESGIPENGIDLIAPSERMGRERGRDRTPIRKVINDFGAICVAIMNVARTEKAQISPREYQVLNESLDVGMAEAVTAYTASRDVDRDQDSMQQLGIVTHELRNALHAATVSFAAIRAGRVPAAGRTADLVDRSHRRLRALVARFAAAVRLRARIPLRREPVDVGVVVLESLDMIEADAAEKDLSVATEIDVLGTVSGDAEMLLSAISNVFQNAVKYSLPRGAIAFRARATATTVVIEAEDACGGLPPGAEAAMFAPFRQMGPDRSGLGLGLTLAREIVDGHRGTISVKNHPGRGCVFTIELPKS
ncbi:MAG: sensor histidine kinase [Myxococcales bacterium]